MSGTSHVVNFAGHCISIECDDPDSSRIVERLYGHLSEDRSIPPQAKFRLGREQGGPFVLFCDDTLEYRGPCAGMVTAMLLDRSVYHLALAQRDGILLHAACAARDGRAVIMPGESGAGKTTLTAWLARRGFHYLTDELVFVRKGSTRVEAFRRPLNIKRGAQALDALFAVGNEDAIVQTPDGYLVSPSLLEPSSESAEAEACLIVFPRYQDGAEIEMQPISAGRTALRLLACLVNARQLPEHGLAQASELARTLPAYTLTWGNLEQIGERMEWYLERAPSASRRDPPWQ